MKNTKANRYAISGKTALITGATSGIGEACARHFASHGGRVLLCARREERLKRLETVMVS